MILNDQQINDLCKDSLGHKAMIRPFNPSQRGKPSWGLGSFGYDIRLASNYKASLPDGGVLFVDSPNERQWEDNVAGYGGYIKIPANSFILAESMEVFNIPKDIMGICWGKSSLARNGILINVTPLEPMWTGTLTIEIANLGRSPVGLPVGEGIAQICFFRGQAPDRTYTQKESGGKYQDQRGVQISR